jgi:hypothetical protein
MSPVANETLDDGRLAVRYLRGLPRFLRTTLSPAECLLRVREQLDSRDGTFVQLLERAVFANPRSPYRPLLAHLGIEPGDIAALVRDCGAAGTAEALYESGARLSLEEFKCRRPIVRDGLELRPQPSDFDNPLVEGQIALKTGGSTGPRRRIVTDLETLTHHSAYAQLWLEALGAEDRPAAIWYPLPPGVAGIAQVLHRQKLGKPVDRWYTQTKLRLRGEPGPAFLTVSTLAGSKLWGAGSGLPKHVPPERAEIPARWLAEHKQSGSPGLLYCTPSSAVRVCRAAQELGIDISGSVIRLGGEPYTEAKARVIQGAGCRAGANYYSSEVGTGGILCGAPTAPDDCHLTSDGLAVVQRDTDTAAGRVGVLHFTSLRLDTRKVTINVESGDYATIESRDCGCPVAAAGLGPHLHTIRSYEKLATEGMNFLGSEIHTLVEEVLPSRFGGVPTDYQFVEAERDGLTRLELRVSPRLGPLDAAQVRDAVLGHLAAPGAPGEMMSEVLRLAETLQVERGDPHVTEAGKTLVLQPLVRS